jgi:hypothetical protein
MTVCVGAVCAGGEKVVVAADRMFTFNAPVSLEFETGEKKIEAISTAYTLVTGGNTRAVGQAKPERIRYPQKIHACGLYC